MAAAAGPPPVLQIFEPAVGGVPAYVERLVEGLARRGWPMHVASRPRSVDRRRLEAAGARLHPLMMSRALSPRDVTTVRHLVAICRREGVQLIHGHSTKASLLAGLTARWARVPSLYTPHGWAFDQRGGRTSRACYATLERVLANRCHLDIALVSQHERALAARRLGARARLHVVLTGVPPLQLVSRDAARRALGLERQRPWVAWIGRHAVQKRPQDLPALAAELGRAGVGLVALGDGLPGSREGVEASRAGACVLVEGSRPELVLSAADVVALTSSAEGLPLVALEAMISERPVVGYDIPPLREQIEPGVCGELTRVGAVHELAARAAALAHDTARARAFGAAGARRAAARFGYERMLDDFERLYGDAVQESAISGAPAALESPVRA